LPGHVAGYTLAGEEGAALRGQVQPAGVDLRVSAVYRFRGSGGLGVKERVLAPVEPVEAVDGWWWLSPGAYKVVFADAVYVPSTTVGICFPRSSLLRSGVLLSCAVWDPGYYGRGEALLEVVNPHGFRLEVGARVAQLVYIHLLVPARLYSGRYRGENMGDVSTGDSS